MTRTQKLISLCMLFAAALGLLVVGATTHRVLPVALTWVPLLAAPWVLIRPEPPSEHHGDERDTGSPVGG